MRRLTTEPSENAQQPFLGAENCVLARFPDAI